MSSEVTTKIEARKLDRVVAILTYLRSGSGLMSSLLDGHVNVLTTPDCILMGFQQFWDKNGHLKNGELVSEFMVYYGVLFDARAKSKCTRSGADVGEYLNYTSLGPDRDECLLVDRDAFETCMMDIIGTEEPVTRKLLFQALHVAYAEALGRSVTNPLIVYGLHVNNASSIRGLRKDFPDALFLQMVRQPVQAVGSHLRHRVLTDGMRPGIAISTLARGLYVGAAEPLENSPNWRAVRMEDLHRKPQETLEKVCDWLNLDWQESLLESTVNGKQWWNEKNTLQISGTNDAFISQRYEDYIPGFDKFRLSVLFAPKREAWGYPVSRWHRSIVTKLLVLPLLLVPLKMERKSDSPFSGNYPKAMPFIGRFARAIHSLLTGRKFMLRAWLNMLKGSPHELKPL